MPSLKLEDHVLRLLEHERVVLGFLNRTAHTWEWELDLPRGEILFREPGTGRILFSSHVKLIGTYSQDAETFRFGWMDPAIPEDWQCVTSLGRLRVTARGAGLEVFDSIEPIPLNNTTKALTWSFACAGYLGAYSVFEARQNRQTHFLTLTEFPDSELMEKDIHIAMQIIDEGRRSFSLHHREAVEAYLGKPYPLLELPSRSASYPVHSSWPAHQYGRRAC
jgi:hypothetical protein